MKSEEREDLPVLLKRYLQEMKDFVKKLKGGYLEEELEEEKVRIDELSRELRERNRNTNSPSP